MYEAQNDLKNYQLYLRVVRLVDARRVRVLVLVDVERLLILRRRFGRISISGICCDFV